MKDTGNYNTGDYNTGDRNTGNYNTGNYNTGYWNTGYLNTGDRNTGNYNTGDRNTGNYNTGDRNTGYWNTGNLNTGDYNTGDWNTGYYNTGDYNTGYWNTGDYNTGDWNTGFFNTDRPKTIRVFEKECDYQTWEDAAKPNFLCFMLTEWIHYSKMNDEEKEKYPHAEIQNGYLKEYTYQEAFKKSLEELNVSERKKQLRQLIALPNFDKKIFEAISGINIDDYDY